MKRFFYTLFLLLLSLPIYGQRVHGERQVEIFFDCDSRIINFELEENDTSLSELTQLVGELQGDERATIQRIEIEGYTSPEGDLRHNNRLSQDRAQVVAEHLRCECGVAEELIVVRSRGVAWDMLRASVESSATPAANRVVKIIDQVAEETWRRVRPDDLFATLVDSRLKRLMDLNYGRSYNYMEANIFPSLRRSNIVISYARVREEPILIEPITAEWPTIEPKVFTPQQQPLPPRSLRFALKSNLLYDVLLTPNIELEIPIKNRWSVAGEWIFPWWVSSDNRRALQILSGQLEGRYWLGNREDRPQLTGWFAGLYAGGGLYDVQWGGNGYQGEFYLAAGLSAGYTHAINKSGNLRMEYSVGVGYLRTNYRHYECSADNQFLVWQHDGTYTWLGPTKVKASLVWFVDWQRQQKQQRGGGRR